MVRIVLCDDNSEFLEHLQMEIKRILEQYIRNFAVYAFHGMEEILPELFARADAFFLDINFDGQQYTGIDIAEKIRKVNREAAVVFVTGDIRYALKGYEVQAFRYLLKNNISSKLERCIQQILEKLALRKDAVMFAVSGKTLNFPLADVLFLESQGHNVLIHMQPPGTAKSKQYCLHAALTDMEKQLCSKGFLRIQRSFLVNMRRMIRYQCKEATFDTGLSLKASPLIYSEQKKKYLLWQEKQSLSTGGD